MNMNANSLKVYEILKGSWGEEKASTVMDYLENNINEKIKEGRLATKEDVLKLETVIADKYANTIKWLFLFWVGTIGSVIAIIKFL